MEELYKCPAEAIHWHPSWSRTKCVSSPQPLASGSRRTTSFSAKCSPEIIGIATWCGESRRTKAVVSRRRSSSSGTTREVRKEKKMDTVSWNTYTASWKRRRGAFTCHHDTARVTSDIGLRNCRAISAVTANEACHCTTSSHTEAVMVRYHRVSLPICIIHEKETEQPPHILP